MRLIFLMILSFISLTLLISCDSSSQSSTKIIPPEWGTELFLGIIPQEKDAKDHYTPFSNYLSQQLGVKVTVIIPNSYQEVIDGLKKKQLHFALLGPKSYIEANKQANTMTAIRIIDINGEKGYKGIIIVNKDSNYNQFSDLENKSWAFTDDNSTSGYLIPSIYFASIAHIDPKRFFSQITFSGNHDNSILKVKNGEVAAAATNNVALQKGAGKKWQLSDFRILWESEFIPNDMFAYRQDIPDSLKQAFTQAALNYHDQQGLTAMGATRLVSSQDEDYAFIRKLVEFQEQLKTMQ